ncbi:MAG: AAA family ATPase [Bacteroidales bacterium]|nr:AAA family ATPase [Bacteroidales bacterium]
MLRKIGIQGYKSIKQLDLELNPINILIGANGVGKTNFISFFKLVNNIYEQRLQQYSLQNGVNRLLHYGVKSTKRIVSYLNFGSNSYEFTLCPADNDSLFLAEENSIYSGRTDSYPRRNILESTIKESNYPRNRWLKTYLESYKIYHFHDTSKGSPLRTDANINDNRYLKTDGDNLPAYLYMLQKKYPKTLKRIEMVIKSVMPYFERFNLEPFSLNESKISLQWTEIGNQEKYFDANDLSDGSIRFIALTTLLLQPELPHMIIIDEPELGLHPVAINKLAGMIKSVADRKCQIIISTQSVNLINNFEPTDIITVDKKEGQSIFNRLNQEDLSKWLEDYSLGELWTKSIINGQPFLL